jgi:hypothetical protein
MPNFEELKRRRDKEREERQAAKAPRTVTQSVGPALRSRHARMPPRRSIDEVWFRCWLARLRLRRYCRRAGMDSWAAEEREFDVDRRLTWRPSLPTSAFPRSWRACTGCLLASPVGWRRVSIAKAGANPRRVLGIDPPLEPYAGWNLTDRRAPVPTIQERVDASRLLERHVELPEAKGLLRPACSLRSRSRGCLNVWYVLRRCCR